MGRHPSNRYNETTRAARRRTFANAIDEAWVTCEVCGKRTYHSRKSAKRAANAHGYNETPYECDPDGSGRGSGRWHLTTANMDTKEWFRERDEIRGLRRERGGQDGDDT